MSNYYYYYYSWCQHTINAKLKYQNTDQNGVRIEWRRKREENFKQIVFALEKFGDYRNLKTHLYFSLIVGFASCSIGRCDLRETENGQKNARKNIELNVRIIHHSEVEADGKINMNNRWRSNDWKRDKKLKYFESHMN